ncbi:MAG TPA: VOC family protein [Stellaceae bacterium]|jgi:predicted 3-demethylubiquinone-9 3-methyltransferase (glyoxalase superfamily)|nr:VOC family protein [Stellaceae bacterium]
MQKITPFLWLDGHAEEAAAFYVSLFANSRIIETMRYGEAGPGQPGAVMLAEFELEGQRFIALNGGGQFKFSPALSLFVDCQTQGEIDALWGKFCDGGRAIQCGWVTDKFGVTWQIVPNMLLKLLQDKDTVRSQRVMRAMMQMVKLDIAALQRAYDGD